jgi:hypothetical protein
MIHSIECEQQHKKWDEMYPNRCKICNGAGGQSYPGTYWEPPDYIECDECIGQGKCPLCGAEIGEGIPLDCFLDDSILPCGHTYDNEAIVPYCDCDEYPMCSNDRHRMEYAYSKTAYEVSSGREIELDIEVFRCPFCKEEKELVW